MAERIEEEFGYEWERKERRNRLREVWEKDRYE